MKISVLVMTYNHKEFIAQALDSVLMQETDFPYEILISEDCSTDGTREIVQTYHRRFPEKIRLLLSERNLASNAVVVRGIEAARGQYVALLDGDDYWTSPYKLQKQADFLDTHPECALCFHNALVVHEDGSQEPWLWTPPDHPQITTLAHLWMGNYIATCSTMFRKGLFPTLPAWYESFFPITDWPLHILNAEHGKIGYIDEVMGVYRYHSGGCYSRLSQPDKLTQTLQFYQRMNACLDFKYDTLVRTAIAKYFFEWAEEYLRRGEKGMARWCFKQYLKGRPLNQYISLRRMVALWLRLYLPGTLQRGLVGASQER
ncbi:MAG: glycosyltransferase [Candidatus Binatia bacterium]|nr:glycosyltransferase [Candidatus Binatia bacterium]